MTQEFKELLISVDILNTLHGGISESQFNIEENEGKTVIRIRVPGVDRENIKAEINNFELSIYYIIKVESSGSVIDMPKILFRQALPNTIKSDEIEAEYDYDTLVVILPTKVNHWKK